MNERVVNRPAFSTHLNQEDSTGIYSLTITLYTNFFPYDSSLQDLFADVANDDPDIIIDDNITCRHFSSWDYLPEFVVNAFLP